MHKVLFTLWWCVLTLVGGLAQAQVQSPESEAAWLRIQELKQKLAADAPAGVNEVEFSAPTQAELHRYATDFANTFTRDLHRAEAMLLEMKTASFPASIPERRDIFSAQEQLLNMIGGDPYVTPLVHKDAERTLLRQRLDHLDLLTTGEDASSLEKQLASFVERFPADPKIGALQVRRVDLLEKVDPKQAAALLDQLAACDDPNVATVAKGRLEKRTLLATPLDWKFTAVDGTSVDLPQWRGRFVLIEFWASWCPDCLREMPDVLAAYQKYHAKGLEVIGVSLDRDKAALESFLKKRRISWPQLYDGKGWEAEIPVKYGVKGIPEIWLLDKEGRVTASGLHGSQLETKLAPLLGP